MEIRDCTITYLELVHPVHPDDLMSSTIASGDRRRLPIAQGGVPSALLVEATAPTGDRYSGFIHRGGHVIDPASKSRWAGDTNESKFWDFVSGATPDGSDDLTKLLGAVGDARIDLDPETGEGTKELQWFGRKREGLGANLAALAGSLRRPAAAPAAAAASATPAP